MSHVTIHQITSLGNYSGQAFVNVNEEYGYINIWGSLFEHETYLMIARNSGEFHLVQFDRDTSQENIAEFFDARRTYYRIIQIKKDEFVTELCDINAADQSR